MKDEYIIINKTVIQKRIKDLKENLKVSETSNDGIRASIESFEIKQLEWVLSQSTPLIPEIEKAFDSGGINMHNKAIKHNWKGIYQNVNKELFKKTKQDYISNLKLDI